MGKRNYGTGTITPRTRADGSIAYRCAIRTPGGQRESETFDNEPDAERWLLERSLALRAGTYREPSKLTIETFVIQYIERGAGRWAQSTTNTYSQRYEDYIVPELGKVRVVDLDTHRVQVWIDKMRKAGTSPSVIDSCFHILGGAMKEAMRLGIIDKNPTVGATVPSTNTEKVGQTWTVEQVGRVLAQLDDHDMYATLYRVALSTGMRPGEVRALGWDAIDMRRRVIHVRVTVTKNAAGQEVIGTTTKGRKDRSVVVSSEVIGWLRAWRTQQGQGQRLVFPSASGTLLRSNAWERKHTRLCAKAQVPKIRLHDLRHTYATQQLEAGVHPKIVQEVLGHKTIQQTLDTYTHVSHDLQAAAAESLSARLFPTRTNQNRTRQHDAQKRVANRARRRIDSTIGTKRGRKRPKPPE